MQIYLARNNQQAGPYSLEQVNQMLAAQQVLLTDLIWHQGMSEWKTLGEVTGGQFYYQPTQETASPFPAVTPVSIQETSSPHQATTPVLATRGKRIWAKLVDLALLLVPQFVVSLLYFPTAKVAELMENPQEITEAKQLQLLEAFSQSIPDWLNIAILVYTLFLLVMQLELIRQSGQSIGKKLFKLKIVDRETFQQVGSLRAFFLRSFLFLMISQFIMVLPLLMTIFMLDLFFFFGKGQNSFHDRIAKTTVIQLESTKKSS